MVPPSIPQQYKYLAYHRNLNVYTKLCFEFCSGLALITKKEARLWTDGRYFLQATQQLSEQWQLMRIGEDPAVDVWMADVSHRF